MIPIAPLVHENLQTSENNETDSVFQENLAVSIEHVTARDNIEES